MAFTSKEYRVTTPVRPGGTCIFCQQIKVRWSDECSGLHSPIKFELHAGGCGSPDSPDSIYLIESISSILEGSKEQQEIILIPNFNLCCIPIKSMCLLRRLFSFGKGHSQRSSHGLVYPYCNRRSNVSHHGVVQRDHNFKIRVIVQTPWIIKLMVTNGLTRLGVILAIFKITGNPASDHTRVSQPLYTLIRMTNI